MKKFIVPSLVLAAATLNASAASLGDTYFEFGAGYTRFHSDAGDDFNLGTAKITGNVGLFDFGPFGLDVRGDYSYSGDFNSDETVRLQQARAELVLHGTFLKVLTPYATFGGVWAGTDYPGGVAGSQVDTSHGGFTGEVGLQWGVLPEVLYITPSYRYTRAGDNWEGSFYQLDVTLWFTYVGAGVQLAYHDFTGSDAYAAQALAYVTFRF